MMLKRAIYNAYSRKKHSVSIILLLGIFAFFLTASSVMIQAITDGLASAQSRLGADIMIVPKGYAGEFEGILLCSEPGTIRFRDDLLEELRQIDGIREVSGQMYIASLAASCCSVPVQIVGLDYQNDFVVKPWIAASLGKKELEQNDVIVGYLVEAQPGDEILLYGTSLKVTSRLAQTGNGFDACVFMSEETVKSLLHNAPASAAKLLEVSDDRASCYMGKVADYSKIDRICEEIEKRIPETEVIVTNALFGKLRNSVSIVRFFVMIMLVLLWVILFSLLCVSLYISVNSRKKEFGLYRVIGYSERMLFLQLLEENVALAVTGGLAGVFTALLIVYAFKNVIASVIGLPYASLGMMQLIRIILLGCFFSSLICIIITFILWRVMKKNEIAQLIKEGI